MKKIKQILLVGLLCVLPLRVFALDLVTLRCFDALTARNAPAQLAVKVERDMFFPYRPDVKGARVGFYKDQKLLGVSESNRDGMATLKVETLGWELGKNQIVVKLLSSEAYKSNNQVLNVYVWKKNQKIIVTDIDQTLVQATKWQVLNSPVEVQRPFAHSARVLNRLKSTGHKIFYLTAREDSLMDKTRRWLNYHRFPSGPLKVWDLDLWGGTPWGHGQYKYQAVRKLHAQFPNLVAGFGDRPHDIEAYLMNDLAAYLLRSSSNADDSFSFGAIEYESWDEVEELISTERF